jgi:beta-1,2-mannosidase
MEASEPFELPGGCEDPRVVEVGGTYYMTYTGYDGVSARLCLATSRDLLRWRKHGPLFPDFQTRTVGKPWSNSGAILTRPLKGLYYMYFGDVLRPGRRRRRRAARRIPQLVRVSAAAT